MKRIALGAVLACFLLPFVADAGERKFILKIGFSTNMEDPRALAALEFKRLIEDKSGGSLSAELFPSGQLGGDAALIEALALDSGTVDIIITDASNFATYEPKMGISAMPFNFETYEDAWAFMDSDVEKSVEDLMIEQNMRVLSTYCNGFRCVTTSKIEIKTPDDMKGLLIRTPENLVIMATMRALGANPQPLAFSELYMALQQGTYDAQENPIPVIYNNKLFEVQKNLSITNHIYSGMCFTFSESVWGQLSDSQKKIIADAAKSSAAFNRKLNKQMAEDFIDKLGTAGGMKIINPDLDGFKKVTEAVYDNMKNVYGDDLLKRLADWKAMR